MSSSYFLKAAAVFSLAAGMAGCGVANLVRPEEAPTVVLPIKFTIVADRDLNLDAGGIAKPVVLRIYELRSAASFDRASFQDMMDKDESMLGADFVRREELVMLPGETKTLERKGNADVRSFGFFVAYRNLEKGVWRTTVGSPGSAEMRRTWMGLGSVEKALPVNYRIALGSDTVRVQVQTPSTATVPASPATATSAPKVTLPSKPSMPSMPSLPSSIGVGGITISR